MVRGLRRWVGLAGVTALALAVGPGVGSGAAPVAALPSVQELTWFSIGGPFDYTPPEVVPASQPSYQYVVQMGQDGQPYWYEYDGGGWFGPNALGGSFLSTVVPAVPYGSAPTGSTEVVGIGDDLAMWYRTIESGSGWASLGGRFVSSPTAGRFLGTTWLFGVGEDDAVWYATPGSGWTSLGGVVFSDLTLVSDGARLWVVGIGNDGAMWTRGFDGATWTGWQSLGGISRTYGVSARLGGDGYLFMVGNDAALWYQRVSASTGWSGWIALGGRAVTPPAAAADTGGGVTTFVVGPDLALYSRRGTPGGGWGPWRYLGGEFISAPGAGATHVYGIGIDEDLYVAPYL